MRRVDLIKDERKTGTSVVRPAWRAKGCWVGWRKKGHLSWALKGEGGFKQMSRSRNRTPVRRVACRKWQRHGTCKALSGNGGVSGILEGPMTVLAAGASAWKARLCPPWPPHLLLASLPSNIPGSESPFKYSLRQQQGWRGEVQEWRWEESECRWGSCTSAAGGEKSWRSAKCSDNREEE